MHCAYCAKRIENRDLHFAFNSDCLRAYHRLWALGNNPFRGILDQADYIALGHPDIVLS